MEGGIPDRDRYRAVVASDEFESMKAVASQFRERHRGALALYDETWTNDPLHQWSRQWEYPYVLDRVTAAASASSAAAPLIVDAGSGVTFFPFLLASRLPAARIIAVDFDSMVGSVFEQVVGEAGTGERMSFVHADMAKTTLDEASADVVYSVSALEHLPHRRDAVAELARIAKPGGTLVVTFDIGLRGGRDLPVAEVPAMLGWLAEHFDRVDAGRDEPYADAVTTAWATSFDERLSPWRVPPLRYAVARLARGKSPAMPVLTFHCSTWRRRSS